MRIPWNNMNAKDFKKTYHPSHLTPCHGSLLWASQAVNESCSRLPPYWFMDKASRHGIKQRFFCTSWTNESYGNAYARLRQRDGKDQSDIKNMQTIFCFLWVLDVLVKSQSNLGKRCLAISHLEFGHLISTSRWKCVLLLNASSTLHEILGARKTMLLLLLFAKCSTIQLNTHTFGCTSSAWKNTAGMITNTHNYKTPLKPTKNFGTLNETGLFASEAKTSQIDKQWPKCVNKSIPHWCKTQHITTWCWLHPTVAIIRNMCFFWKQFGFDDTKATLISKL